MILYIVCSLACIIGFNYANNGLIVSFAKKCKGFFLFPWGVYHVKRRCRNNRADNRLHVQRQKTFRAGVHEIVVP